MHRTSIALLPDLTALSMQEASTGVRHGKETARESAVRKRSTSRSRKPERAESEEGSGPDEYVEPVVFVDDATKSRDDKLPEECFEDETPYVGNKFGTKIYLLAMQYNPDGEKMPDTIRIRSMIRNLKVRVFSTTYNPFATPSLGYAPSNFNKKIHFVRELKPDVIILDYFFIQNFFTAQGKYGDNWFSEKIPDAFSKSGASLKAFIMPFSSDDAVLKMMEKSGDVTGLTYYKMRLDEAETLHPLWKATQLADDTLARLTGGGQGKINEIQKRHVTNKTNQFSFVVVYRKNQPLREIKELLENACTEVSRPPQQQPDQGASSSSEPGDSSGSPPKRTKQPLEDVLRILGVPGDPTTPTEEGTDPEAAQGRDVPGSTEDNPILLDGDSK